MKLTRDKKIYLPDIDNDPTWCEGYENNQFFQAMKYVPNRHTALDVGAHVGIWTIRLAQLFTDVIAFEPVPDHVECWYANTKTFTNVELNELALSNKSEVVKMKQARHSGTSSLEYNPSQLRTSTEIEISTQTLDSFNLSRVDFMKIDVEGHEMPMLEGAKDTIDVYAPIIFIEILKKELKKDINAYGWLLDRGYEEIAQMGSYNYLFAK
jgi:FkbM family methyltransferase